MRRLKIGSFGYGGNSWLADQFRDVISDMGHTLLTCHEYPNADVPYSRHSIKGFIDSCDIIILPTRSRQPAKSSNRLVLAWSRGKAVIVSPQHSYMDLVIDGENALVAKEFSDFPKCIEKLANDPALLEKLGKNGFSRCMLHENGFNPVNHARKLMMAIESYHKHQAIPKVHVAIPHYAPRTDYLLLAVRSVLASKEVEVTVAVASSSRLNPSDAIGSLNDSRVKVYHQEQNMTFSQATNMAISMSSGDPDYYLLLNDDTIVSDHSLSRMIKTSRSNGDAVVNPFSNCDYGWLHTSNIRFGNKQLVPAMDISQFTEEEFTTLSKSQFSDDLGFRESPFAAFFATLIHKDVYNKVGRVNEEFRNGGEDADWCFRAKKMGIKVGWTPGAFIFHFGGKSRKVSHETRGDEHILEDKYNNEMLAKKWPRSGKRVCIWTGPAWEKWDILSYKRPLPVELGGKPNTASGIGGSETSAARLAMEFAKAGHYVLMVGDHPKIEQCGVHMMPWQEFHPEEHYFDLFIASRNLNCVDQRLRAGKVAVWIHDIFILSNREPNNEINQYHLNKVDYFIALSPWHKDFIRGYHKNIPEDKIRIIPNGINVELFR